MKSLSFDGLERDGLIRRLPVDGTKVRDSFALAQRDIKTSRSLLDRDPDWAFSIAYNAILQAARALMFSEGYRPHGRAQHISAIRFMEVAMGEDATEIIVAFDRKGGAVRAQQLFGEGLNRILAQLNEVLGT